MPELPEVETVRRGLAPVMENAIIERLELRRPNLRFDFPKDFVSRVEGTKVISISRRAKYILVDLASGDSIIMHLGMSGSFRIELDSENTIPGIFHNSRNDNLVHDHVVFHLLLPQGRARIVYNDPRRFGFMEIAASANLAEHVFIKKLGVEPIGNSLSSSILADMLKGKSTTIKAALLDQRLIAGLGNIYVCEALHASQISPLAKAGSLVLKTGAPSKRLTALVENIRDVIEKAILAGGSSLRDHRQVDGNLGYFQHQFRVYDCEGKGCPNEGCKAKIERIVQSGRSSFYCPSCQRS